MALATRRSEDGGPQVALAAVATDLDGSPILLLSELSEHTRNIAADGRVAILFDGTEGYRNPQTGPRVTIFGKAVASAVPRHRARYLARHEGAALYADFSDFRFFHVEVTEARLVGGFAQAETLAASALLFQGPWAEIAEAEAEILAHMNDEHRDSLALIARAVHPGSGKHFRMIGIDPEGCDLRVGRRHLRVPFPSPVATAADVRRVLVALTQNARENEAKMVVLQQGQD